MLLKDLKQDVVVRGPLFPEPVQVLVVTPMGTSVKVIATGLNSGKTYQPVLTQEQLAQLDATPEREPFDGESMHFRIGIEALRLGLAYEYDPYFSLSIARVDPLPHQLEAVYDYFLKLPRIRFLLADDPGAGKTIMAGLLIKELKIRGLVKRTLILTPASLSFQWQREMKDKFRENFEVIRGDVLRANYGSNPWQDKNQVVTSVSWVSVIEDAKESLLRSHWDLIVVDEAHKMSATGRDDKTLAYQLGERLSQMTDHYLLMTATPHKGDPKQFCLFLELLDRDVYGDVKSLEEAMAKNNAPFYLRRSKEALVSFPEPDTGKPKALFTKRNVTTTEFQLNADEFDFYDALTRFVEDQSIRATDDARGRALTFTMAMLQRRFASSIYAARRSLERMKEKREKILADPDGYRQEQIAKKVPENFEDLPDEEQQRIMDDLEEVVASIDPAELKKEIVEIARLVEQARALEQREVESKLTKLKEVITQHGVFRDPKMKLLLFTEHKDTLDYLTLKLSDEWKLSVTQIHGGMKIGDRDTPGTRIYAEREFRETAQVLVATEAAGEGINLQFCWLMINYDIPWNPIRLEQRMGRIHRYGQEKDCLIFNFVSTSTREGRVLQKLFERIKKIEDDLDPQRTGKVFNVMGDIFPANQIERMIRDMYARNLTDDVIKDRIVEQLDTERFRRITHSTLEGLAKKELNLSAIVGKTAEAKERRLVPEVIEDFFVNAGPLASVTPKEVKKDGHQYRIGRVPSTLWKIGERLEPRFGKLGREYQTIVFDKEYLKKDATLEWVTPGHPLFEAVREDVSDRVQDDLRRGAIFYDINVAQPSRLDVFAVAITDGLGRTLHRRLFVIQTAPGGALTVKQPTVFLDLAVAPKETALPDGLPVPVKAELEHFLVTEELTRFLAEVAGERKREIETIERHVEISLNASINRVQIQFAELEEAMRKGKADQGAEGRLSILSNHLEELNGRLDARKQELRQEREVAIGEVRHLGAAWVLPHPERTSPSVAPMVRDEEVERIAVETVTNLLEVEGWVVESVEAENRGFDLIARKPHPEDPKTAMAVRFIEVKGRSGVGEVALSSNEYKTAVRLKTDYWLYVVFDCSSTPQAHAVQDPAQLEWKAVVRVEHYHVQSGQILRASK